MNTESSPGVSYMFDILFSISNRLIYIFLLLGEISEPHLQMMFGDAELLQDGSARLPGQPLVPLFPGRQEQVVVPGLLDEPERDQLLGCQWRMEYFYVISVILIDSKGKK